VRRKCRSFRAARRLIGAPPWRSAFATRVSDDAVEGYPVDERIEVRGNRDLDGGSFVTGDCMDDRVGPLAHR
jgi:hypothetical protein